MNLGGEEPSGWIPPGAARPRPTPVEPEVVDVQIVGDQAGYILRWAARPSPTNPEPLPPKVGDQWYETLADAEMAARELFDIAPDDWDVVSGEEKRLGNMHLDLRERHD